MKSEIIYEDDNHKWICIGRDIGKADIIIDSNEYLIISNGEGFLLDPGGLEIFPEVLGEVTKHIEPKNIKGILSSHQDPDIASSFSLWFEICPDVKIYASRIWISFLQHFALGTGVELLPVPDIGMELPIGNSGNNIYLVPAHYCHSSGNFSAYDPKADILFSGDIGGALLPDMDTSLYVDNFQSHIQYMEGFHKRWIPYKKPVLEWTNRVRNINPNLICPQHGSIFRQKDIEHFLSWLENLEYGVWDNSIEQLDINDAPWLKWKKNNILL